jgi:hypothetical protein
MPTVVLDAYSKAYPSITNRIRASVTVSNDTAIVASIIDTTVGHPARIWHFPGLPRNNYAFSLDEINAGGVPINNLAFFDVVPGPIDGTLVRDDEQIQVGSTTGFDAGATSATFDGSGGRPNYIGWEIVPSELTGRGILVEGLDYSWDPLTGVFNLLQPGDIFTNNTWFNIHFNPLEQTIGASVPQVIDFSARVVTVSETLTIGDFGNTIIAEPDGTYIELTLPPITTVTIGRALTIEVKKALGANMQCVKVIADGADVMNFLRGNLYLMNNESVQIYRFRRVDLTDEWRLRLADGNFRTVGGTVNDDLTQVDVYCKLFIDGSVIDKFQFARLYNEVVLNLPTSQLVDFDDWSTGNNRFLFSRANSADPDNADKFHLPDRRNLFERNNNVGKAGDYFDDKLKPFWAAPAGTPVILKVDGTNTEIGTDNIGATSPNIRVPLALDMTVFGTEVMPKHYLINKYILV